MRQEKGKAHPTASVIEEATVRRVVRHRNDKEAVVLHAVDEERARNPERQLVADVVRRVGLREAARLVRSGVEEAGNVARAVDVPTSRQRLVAREPLKRFDRFVDVRLLFLGRNVEVVEVALRRARQLVG